MKRYLLILLTVALCACEVIDEANRYIPVPLPPAGSRKHVLFDCTGFRCVNCPNAAELAQSLTQTYVDQLFVVSLHPASNPFTQGLYDYTCPEADSIYLALGGTASTPFPAGNLDLALYNGDYLSQPSEWPTMVYNAMTDTVAPYLDIKAYADTVHHTIETKAIYDKDAASLITLLVEDSVLGAQAMPDGSVNMAYYHRHMLRAASLHGETLRLPEQCRVPYCTVVAVLIDNNNHIIQADETILDLSANH